MKLRPPLSSISIFFDVWLYLDILMTFRTGFVKSGIDGEIVFHPVAIRKEYMAFWFWIDLISTVPLDVIISCLVIMIRFLACYVFRTPLGSIQLFGLDFAQFAKMIKLIRLAKLLKMVRITKIMRNI